MRIWKIYKIIFIIILFFGIERFCRSQTGGFRPAKVCAEHDYGFQETSHEIPSEIRYLLQQSFTFLGRGVQFFAFIGEDKKTVLKLFKHHHTGIPIDWIEKCFPNCLKTFVVKKREKRMLRLLRSAYIAKTFLSKETGVFFCHLGKQKTYPLPILVKDKLGTSFLLDLEKTEFVLQKKAIPVKKKLQALLQENKIDEAIEAMQKILLLIEERSQKGIKNKDGKILQNCGFIDHDAIEIDIGSYIYRQQSTCVNPHKKASLKAKKQLLAWIRRYYAPLYDRIKKALDFQEIN